MLRVEVENSANVLSLKLQGRLVGEEAKSSRKVMMTHYRAGMELVVDLTELTFVDAAGEEMLSFFGQFGAGFIAETSYSRYICERLQLHVALSKPSNGNTSCPSNANDVRRSRRSRRSFVNN